MKRHHLLCACLSFLLPVAASAATNCSRAELQKAVDTYIAAQRSGDPSGLPLVSQTQYLYNMEPSTLADSIVNQALRIDLQRSLLDEYTCQTYTELVVTDPAHPYVLTTRMRVTAGSITEFESVVTDDGDWLFNPQVTLERSAQEDWSVLPENRRVPRADLVAAANAYFDQFFSGPDTANVPWGTPCNRLEGGAYTGKGKADDSCNVGVPTGMNITNRRFVADETLGAVVGLNRMGPNFLPDSHLFRLVDGKVRYVHTLTVCTLPRCGFGPPPARE